LSHYQQIASVRELVLVDPERRSIGVWRRAARDWSFDAGSAEGASLTTLGCQLPAALVFRDPLAP
jgi:hypothetical protein